MHTLSTRSAEVDTHLRTLQAHMSTLQEQERTPNADQPQSSRAGARTHTGRVRAPRPQSARTRDQQKPEQALDTEDRERVGKRILSTFHELGTDATDTDVARASGYSRTTVARWRKRFIAQGQIFTTPDGAQVSSLQLIRTAAENDQEEKH